MDSKGVRSMAGFWAVTIINFFVGAFWGYFDGQKDGYIQCLQDMKKGNPPAYVLMEHGIQFESRNDGVHLLIETSKGRVNFYPSTGLYNGIISGRGVFNLMEELKGLEQ